MRAWSTPTSISEISGYLPGAFVILQGVVIEVIKTKREAICLPSCNFNDRTYLYPTKYRFLSHGRGLMYIKIFHKILVILLLLYSSRIVDSLVRLNLFPPRHQRFFSDYLKKLHTETEFKCRLFLRLTLERDWNRCHDYDYAAHYTTTELSHAYFSLLTGYKLTQYITQVTK